MPKVVICLAVLLSTSTALAQQSPGYVLEEYTFNAGGHPGGGVTLQSPNFRLSLDSMGAGFGAESLSAASFTMNAGFVSSFRAPGEVANLRLLNATTLTWDAEPSAGTYSLYRGFMSTLPGLGYGGCRQQDIATPGATDSDPVPSSGGFFYLVTVENRLDEEGTKGFRSNGVERTGLVCP